MKLNDTQKSFKEEFKITKSDLLSIPNILCYIRLLLIPLFVILYLRAETKNEYYLAGFVVLVASLTDFLDGFIARKFNMVTEFGKLLDPVVDKLMQASLLFVLLLKIDYMYILVIIFLVKEGVMAVTGFLFLRKGRKFDGSKWFGKVSTTIFYITMLLLIIFPNLESRFIYSLMAICGASLIISFLLYGREYYLIYKEMKSK